MRRLTMIVFVLFFAMYYTVYFLFDRKKLVYYSAVVNYQSGVNNGKGNPTYRSTVGGNL